MYMIIPHTYLHNDIQQERCKHSFEISIKMMTSFCVRNWRLSKMFPSKRVNCGPNLSANTWPSSSRRTSFLLSRSVTRFGEISPLWCNVVKLWALLKGAFTIWRNFELTLAIFYMVLAKCSVLQMAKYCDSKLTNWSHCFLTILWHILSS